MKMTARQRELAAETAEFRAWNVADRARELERQAEVAESDRSREQLRGEANRLRSLERELLGLRELFMQEESIS